MIHRTAIIEDGARLGDNVSVGAYSVIGPEVVIGDNCWIGPHVVINGRTSIDENCRIYQFASVGEAPQDKKYAGEDTAVEIGRDNTIREYVTINRGTADDIGVTRIGDDNWLMAYSHVAHDCQVGSHTVFANGATLAGHVIVGDWVIFAGYSGAHQFCRIGAHAFLGMYGGVNQDVPAYVMVSGQPPRPRGVNAEGLKRRGFDGAQIRNIREAYRLIYRKGLQRDEAVAELRARAAEQPELELMIESIENSQRGLLR
ncbi:acyl-ACP--UDP-N-acetylglucosamine O-acyltransferase [Wenzhouxiangella sp. EGI_FJ10305]|uniref:acyl-ACP--UDP-N-acetylglucosamine O-acyltransferase n=1 Tax=Wenzhouxiangella sp. EGI_FJ10305 TaxID=3243768 RepID=UPI0035DB18B1